MVARSYSDSNDVMNPGVSVAPGTAATASTNILATNYRPKRRPCILRVSVCLQTETTFRAIVNDGTTDFPRIFESDNPLPADTDHLWDLIIDGAAGIRTVNFQTGANATISHLSVEEVNEAA